MLCLVMSPLQDELLRGQREEERGRAGNPHPAGAWQSLSSSSDAASHEAPAHREGEVS